MLGAYHFGALAPNGFSTDSRLTFLFLSLATKHPLLISFRLSP
nr:MAG TPA: hypothetical protein [Bacteriophage sp.]